MNVQNGDIATISSVVTRGLLSFGDVSGLCFLSAGKDNGEGARSPPDLGPERVRAVLRDRPDEACHQFGLPRILPVSEKALPFTQRCSYNSYMTTKTIGARELKNRLGTYLRQVREGTTIVVTDRGRPVAEIRAVTTATTDEEARLQELVALGLLSPRSSTAPPGSKPPIHLEGGLSGALVAEREDRL